MENNTDLYVPEWYDFLGHQTVLLEDLFQGYDATLSPVYTKIDISKPLGYNPLAPKRFNYTISLYYMKLIGVVEPEEKMSLIMEMSEHWYDPRLTWNPTKYGDIEMIHVRQDRVWSPTLCAFGIDDIIDFRDQDFRMVSILNDGHVYTALSARLSSTCRMNVQRFPYDTQTCTIRFYMPIYFQKHVQVGTEIYSGILNKTIWEAMGNSEWDLINLTSRVEILTFYDVSGDSELATFELKIRRNPMYYIYMIIFPSFIINVLSIIGVFMKKTDTMSKLNVGLTNIMTMTFILGVMADKIPRTGYIPLLGVYIIINLFIMIFAVGFTIALGQLKKWVTSKSRGKHQKLSKAMDFLFGENLEIICVILLETLTIVNFTVMIVFWISDP